MANGRKVNHCQCGFAIREMDEALFNIERTVKGLSNEPTNEEIMDLLEKPQRLRMAVRETENACDLNFKEAKSSIAGFEILISEIETEKGKRDVLNRINKVNSEIFRELDNCIDRIRMEK